ncbi:cytidine deaminase [[Clostridium] polysaccharolyticum]|uniref:Cytidine deaminase n=1 Tax=[Clostridium] polysaccharolyticum TaxID=29364 RepID=A0A1I0BSU9_9FIRM|nr:cytidine deaminase [[Clostridium] polysaccharolyticum]SET10038.1 cytidine deaminase [[Clostridium] polysaccharolyticum]
MDQKALIQAAIDTLPFSYSPYSDFKVAAALLSKEGKVYTGCNIESASYTPSNCAERTAFFKAVSEGVREFEAIAIVGGRKGILDDYCPPCGVCRQVMMEFCSPRDFKVILAKGPDDYKEFTLEEILPLGFGPGNLLVDK